MPAMGESAEGIRAGPALTQGIPGATAKLRLRKGPKGPCWEAQGAHRGRELGRERGLGRPQDVHKQRSARAPSVAVAVPLQLSLSSNGASLTPFLALVSVRGGSALEGLHPHSPRTRSVTVSGS